jgi:hypothetical protein
MTDKYEPNGVPLTDHEREVLVIMIEEAAEITQAATKMIRFGRERNPHGVENEVTLSMEIGDLTHMIHLAKGLGLVRQEHIDQGILRKRKKLERYMLTSRTDEQLKCPKCGKPTTSVNDDGVTPYLCPECSTTMLLGKKL